MFARTRVIRALKRQYWPTEIARYAVLKPVGISRKIYRIAFYTFGELEYLVFLVWSKGNAPSRYDKCSRLPKL